MSVPRAITFEHLLEGESLKSLLVGDGWGCKHLVNGVEQVPSKELHALGASLAQLDEIIDKHVSEAQGLGKRAVGQQQLTSLHPTSASMARAGKQR